MKFQKGRPHGTGEEASRPQCRLGKEFQSRGSDTHDPDWQEKYQQGPEKARGIQLQVTWLVSSVSAVLGHPLKGSGCFSRCSVANQGSGISEATFHEGFSGIAFPDL